VELPAFLVTGFMAAMGVSLAGGLISPFIVLRKASFASEAFAHIAFAGMALALLLDLPYMLLTLLFVIVVAYLIGSASARYRLAEVNLASIFLAVSMALGVLFLSMKKGYVPDMADFLFGNILLVADSDLIALGVLMAIDALWLLVFGRSLYYVSYNEEIAAACRIPTRLVSMSFFILMACNIVLIVKLAGVIMVTAGLVLPGSIALLLTRNLKIAHGVSIAASLFAALPGFFFSLAADVPVSVAMVLILFGFFVLALLFHRIKG